MPLPIRQGGHHHGQIRSSCAVAALTARKTPTMYLAATIGTFVYIVACVLVAVTWPKIAPLAFLIGLLGAIGPVYYLIKASPL